MKKVEKLPGSLGYTVKVLVLRRGMLNRISQFIERGVQILILSRLIFFYLQFKISLSKFRPSALSSHE